MHQYSKCASCTYQEIGLPYGDELSFLERVDALLYTLYYRYLFKFVILQDCDKLVKNYFGNDMPHLEELESVYPMPQKVILVCGIICERAEHQCR